MKKLLNMMIKFVKDPYIRFGYLSRLGFYNNMSDADYLKKEFKFTLGYDLNLENPKTFNEKLQWLKLNDRKDIYTQMVDKYESKEYVSKIIGEEYIIPTIGVYDSFDEIDFEALPNQFVMKCTHDSGGLVICKNKKNIDWEAAKKKINKYLKRKYFYIHREWPYKNVKPRIIIEQYIGSDLIDYRFYCFNGNAKMIYQYVTESNSDGSKPEPKNCNIYDEKWNKLDFRQAYPQSKRLYKKPKVLEKLISLSEMLAKNTEFLRVDFYIIDNKIYYGELTFFPGAGFSKFYPTSAELLLGDMLKLPFEKNK